MDARKGELYAYFCKLASGKKVVEQSSGVPPNQLVYIVIALQNQNSKIALVPYESGMSVNRIRQDSS